MADRYSEFRALLPTAYVRFMESHNGWEGDLGERLGYVILWTDHAIPENWEGYQIAENLEKRWFPFGSNGGGEMLCFDLESGTDTVYYIPFIGMAGDEAMVLCSSFGEIAAAIGRNE